ncbi:uncharacterized protein [Arachis hypogaea]|uniref:uncharacterized protein n=1 Tax=Arachis hypogaea TaxID=3818 RepID=UPI003B219A20
MDREKKRNGDGVHRRCWIRIAASSAGRCCSRFFAEVAEENSNHVGTGILVQVSPVTDGNSTYSVQSFAIDYESYKKLPKLLYPDRQQGERTVTTMGGVAAVRKERAASSKLTTPVKRTESFDILSWVVLQSGSK